MFKEKKLKLKGIKLNYVVGPNDGKPLIMLHGLSDSWKTYLYLIPFLTPYYKIYAIDLRGHGKSGRAANYKIIDYVPDIAGFLSKKFNQPVSLIGHSLGASIIFYIAAKNPELCKSITLIDPFVFKDKLKDKEFIKYFTLCLNLIKKYKDKDLLFKNVQETGAAAKKRTDDFINLDNKTIIDVLDKKVFDGFELEDLIKNIICPVLVLRGNPKLLGFISPSKARYLEKNISNCVIEYLSDCSHSVHVDNPVESAKHILNFLVSL